MNRHLRAIREYTAMSICDIDNLHKKKIYVVTIADDEGLDGCVISECDFSRKEDADWIVNKINEGNPMVEKNSSCAGEWEEPSPTEATP